MPRASADIRNGVDGAVGGTASYWMASSARPSRANMACCDLTVLSGQVADANKLGEELTAEHTVVFQSLIATFEPRGIGCVASFTGALRRHRVELKTPQQIGPEIGHS